MPGKEIQVWAKALMCLCGNSDPNGAAFGLPGIRMLCKPCFAPVKAAMLAPKPKAKPKAEDGMIPDFWAEPIAIGPVR